MFSLIISLKRGNVSSEVTEKKSDNKYSVLLNSFLLLSILNKNYTYIILGDIYNDIYLYTNKNNYCKYF